MTRVATLVSWVLFFAACASPLFAQAPPREGKLLVTVVDQTRAVIPGATVTVSGLEDATKTAVRDPTKTSDQGIATIMLPPGRYLVTAEFPGFEPGVLKDVRIRSGDNRQMIVLAIQGVQDSVTVSRDKQESAADRNNGSFGTALTREQVDALSDDPAEMAQQLQEMAGGNAVMRVDSFEGGQLPPKAMIKSIHVTRDAFAAENHSAGGLFIDIITQPGLGPLRGGGRYNLRDGAVSGRSPFTEVKGPERQQQFGTNFAGTLIKDRASFNLSLNGATSFDTPNLLVQTPDGSHSEALLSLRQPRSNANVYAVLDYAVTKDQTLRINYNQNDFDAAQSRRRRLRSARARVQQRGSQPHAAGAGSRTARAARVHEHPARVRLGRQLDPVRARRGHHPRQRRVHERRRADLRRAPDAHVQPRVGSRLRAQHPLRPRRRRARRRVVPLGRHRELPRHLHLRKPRGVRGGHAAGVYRGASAIRTSTTSTCRRPPTSRTTSACAKA